jgi:putative integral membrane protein (TIGR02587 family)
MEIRFPAKREWREECQDLLRGASGGFLFGIPLLYTMEVWWIGSYTEPPLLLVILAITFVIVFLLNRTDGFRRVGDRPLQAFGDSVEALAIGTVCVTAVLILLREITQQTPLTEDLGKIVLEGVPFAIGVALARSILSGRRDQTGQDDQKEQDADQTPDGQIPDGQTHAAGSVDASSDENQASRASRPAVSPALADVSATLVGTIFIAFNIAPTDEVEMLAAATSPPWLLVMVAASLVISYCIVFAAGLVSQERRLQQQGWFQNPLVETVLAYLLSLCAAAMMLWFFHRLGFDDPWTSWLRQTLVLGLPATIGGAAGRLAV